MVTTHKLKNATIVKSVLTVQQLKSGNFGALATRI
jgi:hypothetical protein